jgi:tetratricopeptide (TPR) repeat protein
VAGWAHQLYPAPSFWGPIRPDPLADQHLADTRGLAALVVAFVKASTAEPPQVRVLTQALGELVAGAPQQPALLAALDGTLDEQLPALATTCATTADATLALLVSEALRLCPRPADAAQVASRLPEHSVALAQLAVELTAQAAAHYRDRAEVDDDFLAPLAGALNALAVRLSGLGRREDALAAGQEAVATYRGLTAVGRDAFLPGLAMTLNNLSNHLSDLGRREDALAASEEAVATYRGLAAARPDAFLPDLAMSLNNLSLHLSGFGRREEALAAIEEAVATYRGLAAARPDAFLPDLAMSLNNLSNGLGGLGRREDALAASEEAVATYRGLAAADLRGMVPSTDHDGGSRGGD